VTFGADQRLIGQNPMQTLLQWLPALIVGPLCAYVLWRALARSDEPVRLAGKWLITALVVCGIWFLAARVIGGGGSGNRIADFFIVLLLVGAIAGGGVALGILWGRNFGELLARPLTSLFDEGGTEIEAAPLYSTAIAHRKQARFEESIAAIQVELERFPGDFSGTLLLAEIQAENLHDLPTAEATLTEWLQHGRHEPGEEPTALTRLAEWHLHLRHDPDRARDFLRQICTRFPDSEAALLAEQRIAHLAHEARPKPGPIHLEAGTGSPVAPGTPPSVPEPPSASVETAELVQHLQVHPHDLAARERLAALYAWTHQRADLARGELETLLELKNTSHREMVHWLHLLADVEIQVARDVKAARAALERVIRLNPKAAAAEQARNRIPFLSREMSRHQPVRVVSQNR